MAEAIDRNAGLSWRCPVCGRPKPGERELDATIEEDKMEKTPLSFIFGYGLGLARKDFLFGLGEDKVREDLYLGRLFSERKGLLDDWVTFNGKHRIFVRGSEHAQHRQCTECGRHFYFAMGRQYLHPQPPAGVAIFDKGYGGLVVTEELAGRITLNRWPKLVCEKLPVLATPLDGFPNLPPP
jgi:hypothetical protein